MRKLVVIAAAAVLAFALAGCGSQAASSSSASSSMSASDTAASSSASAQTVTLQWAKAKNAEEAANGSGVDEFIVPKKGTKISIGELGDWTYYCVDKIAEADGAAGAAEVVIRKAIGAVDTTKEPGGVTGSGRNFADATYANQWNVNMDGADVRCYGNEKGKVSKAIWDDGKYNYSILVLGQGDNWQNFGVPEDDIAVLVKGTKKTGAKEEKKETKQEEQTNQGGNPLSEDDVEQIIWNNGYGAVVSMMQVQLNDGIWYWEVTTRGSDGSEKTWVIDPDGNISNVDVDNDNGSKATSSDVADNNLSGIDPEQVIWEQGLGEVVSTTQVQLNDGNWYWEVTCKGANGDEHTYVIDEGGNVTNVDA